MKIMLEKSIKGKVVCIVGLGYVGLPLVRLFHHVKSAYSILLPLRIFPYRLPSHSSGQHIHLFASLAAVLQTPSLDSSAL